MEPRWQRALLLAGGTAAAAGLLWYLLREGEDEEEQEADAGGPGEDGPHLFFKVTDPKGCCVGIRTQPDVWSQKTGMSLLPGEVFQVSEVVEAEGGQLYLRLADGRGWAFTLSSKDGRLLVQEVSAEESMKAPSGMQAFLQEANRLLEQDPSLREQVLSSPEAQAMMADPSGLQAAAEQSAQVAEALGSRAELAQALAGDPSLAGRLQGAMAEAAAGARAAATATG
mmetsp:Transcript_99455/g.309869  ORF Transcript_99455/g.309869 Transcript_99455/m.309869 type:complete len:226 (-) Transcript_99455:71-748(-)